MTEGRGPEFERYAAQRVDIPTTTARDVTPLRIVADERNRALWVGVRRGILQIVAAVDTHFGIEKDKR